MFFERHDLCLSDCLKAFGLNEAETRDLGGMLRERKQASDLPDEEDELGPLPGRRENPLGWDPLKALDSSDSLLFLSPLWACNPPPPPHHPPPPPPAPPTQASPDVEWGRAPSNSTSFCSSSSAFSSSSSSTSFPLPPSHPSPQPFLVRQGRESTCGSLLGLGLRKLIQNFGLTASLSPP